MGREGQGLKILDRYLARAVVGGTLATLAVLLPLLGFFLLADELDKVGQEGYVFADALAFVALSIPSYAYQIFPIATLIGALIGLGSLASRSELVAMRAAGVSISRIVLAALKAGVLLAVVAFLVGEGIAPVAQQKALQLRSEAESGQVTLNTPYGFWARDRSAYINIREILPGAYLRGVFIYEFDGKHRLTVATHAKAARYVEKHWVLDDISRSKVSRDGVEVSRVRSANWDSLLDPGLLDVVLVDPQALPVWGLFRYIRFMAENNQDPGPYAVAFWGKVVQPLLILAMVFLSIPILLGSARTQGMGVRVFVGIMVGIGFYLVSRTFASLALVYGLSPMVAAITPPLLFLGIALWVMRRVG